MTQKLNLLSRVSAYMSYRRVQFDGAPLLHPVRGRRRAAAQRTAEAYFHSDTTRAALLPLLSRNMSVGAGWTDYHMLHRYIVTRRPRRLLELGSGSTTLVMAHALAQAHRDDRKQPAGHLYSLEEGPRYCESLKETIPNVLAPYVTLLCRAKEESRWRGQIWGFHYAELPPGPFDFVFVDGPTEYRDEEAIRRGDKGVCLDLLYLLERDPDVLLDVVVDQKLNSLEAYRSVLPPSTVRYDHVMDVGVLTRVCGHMLGPRVSSRRTKRGDAWQILGLV